MYAHMSTNVSIHVYVNKLRICIYITYVNTQTQTQIHIQMHSWHCHKHGTGPCLIVFISLQFSYQLLCLSSSVSALAFFLLLCPVPRPCSCGVCCVLFKHVRGSHVPIPHGLWPASSAPPCPMLGSCPRCHPCTCAMVHWSLQGQLLLQEPSAPSPVSSSHHITGPPPLSYCLLCNSTLRLCFVIAPSVVAVLLLILSSPALPFLLWPLCCL